MAQRRDFPVSPRARPESIITADGAKYRFTILTDGLIRYEWAPDGKFEDRASAFAIHRDLPVPRFRHLDKGDEGFAVFTDRFQLYYDKGPFSASGLYVQVLGNVTDHKSLWRYGESGTNLGGTARTLDGVDGRMLLEMGILSKWGYAVLDDSGSMLFDDSGWVAGRSAEGRVDAYLFAYGHDYRLAIQAFYAVSGKQPLLPRWALGNWWSRYYAYHDHEYLALMDEFKEKGVPLSVGVLDMDWHLVKDEQVERSGASGWTGYTWDRKFFPDPEAFCGEIHERGLRLTINDHPADGVAAYEDAYEEMAKALNHDTTSKDPIPFDIADPAFCDAFFDILHRRIERQGCDFWWVDWQSGPYSRIPGVDPLWVLNHFHFLDSARDRRRPITFSRFAGPGSHRYPIGFSGDTIVTWASLEFQPEFTNTASNIGYGWWSHDVGGHMFGGRNDELATRWVQYGVFSPIMRLHSAANPWNTKEPWKFTAEARDIQIEYLRLRHRMMPYLYSMNVRAAVDGEPIIQPMYWDFPKRKEAYSVPNQYLFGSQLIVVPITAPRDATTGLSKARGWLPPGTHVDIFTGAVYDGDRHLRLHRQLSQYPVFARQGSIVPLDAARVPPNGCPTPEAIEILVVVGKDGSFDMIEDDGTGSKAEGVAFARTRLAFSQERGTVTISPCTPPFEGLPPSRRWSVRFLGCTRPASVKARVGDETRGLSAVAAPNGFAVEIGEVPTGDAITVEIGADPQLAPHDVDRHVREIVHNAQVDFDLKNDIWAALAAPVSRVGQIARLQAIEMQKSLLDAVLEHLLADTRTAVDGKGATRTL